jgi:hypothetical protein
MAPSLFLSKASKRALISLSVSESIYSFMALVNSEKSKFLLLSSSKILNCFPIPIRPLAPLLASLTLTLPISSFILIEEFTWALDPKPVPY